MESKPKEISSLLSAHQFATTYRLQETRTSLYSASFGIYFGHVIKVIALSNIICCFICSIVLSEL